MARVSADNLGIRFDLDRQRRPVTPMLTHLRAHCTTEWALRGISFTLEGGRGYGLVGANGAGKTTLLRAIAGVLSADEGRITVEGRLGSLLSTDAGLMPALTGRENAVLLSTLAGLPRSGTRAALPEIAARSGLGQAFERPISTYSQGMKARLGFAVIERTDPDVLLLDEVHEAIDETFRTELEASARRIRERGGIVIAASHDHDMLARLCDTALLIDRSGVHLARSVEEAGSMLTGTTVA
jgi:ABC-type polysaccharide/polyol phosphate transport system ATPase subunit